MSRILLFPVGLLLGSLLSPGSPASVAYLPEVCNNAQDDDQDGLVDLQDPDCRCSGADSRVVNASFEDINCCPDGPGQPFCITSWLQGTNSTPDYMNQCGWMGWDHLPVPLPIPDGRACVGFRNGRFEGANRPIEKEYIGNCLIVNPLWMGTPYHFRFYVGFTNARHSPPTNLIFYGSADCDRLPAGRGLTDLGCPSNDPSWFQIKSIPISGENTWKVYEFDYIPAQTIFSLAIGPDCELAASQTDLYYFFDYLVITDAEVFNFEIEESGAPCSRQFALSVPKADTLDYQWYRNQIALVGETSHRLFPDGREGAYQVAVSSSSKCTLTTPYYFVPATASSTAEAIICEGEHYSFNGNMLDQEGTYVDTLLSPEGCDSIVYLTLRKAFPAPDTLQIRIFGGETYQHGGSSYDQPGTYVSRISAEQGCDSLVYIHLDFLEVYIPNVFSPNGDGLNDYFTIFGGPELDRIVLLQIYDRWGSLIFNDEDLKPNEEKNGWNGERSGQPLPAGTYLYRLIVETDDGRQQARSGAISLIR